jgi:lipopolysaccharide transport system permease protein
MIDSGDCEGFDTHIGPKRGLNAIDPQELFRYRELLYILIWRDLKVRYKQTVLGAAWAIFQPFISMVVFSIFFGGLVKVPSDGLPYPVFVYVGLVPWTFFSNGLSGASNSLIGQSHLISKIYFPRIIIPLSTFGARLVDFAISIVILFGMMLYYNIMPTAQIAVFPVMIILTLMTAMGVGTLLSALGVTYRDVGHIAPFLVQLWMYATPVIYPVSIVPEKWRWILALNPMAGIIEGYRACLLGRPFNWMEIAISSVMAVTLLAIGVVYFKKVERRFADVI